MKIHKCSKARIEIDNSKINKYFEQENVYSTLATI